MNEWSQRRRHQEENECDFNLRLICQQDAPPGSSSQMKLIDPETQKDDVGSCWQFHLQFSILFAVLAVTLCSALQTLSSSSDIALNARWPRSSGTPCNYKSWLIYLGPGWCSASWGLMNMMQSVSASPLSLFLYAHSHYHAKQPFLHKVNFCMWRSAVATGPNSHSAGITKSTLCERERHHSWFTLIIQSVLL